jgi:hypothetical protein
MQDQPYTTHGELKRDSALGELLREAAGPDILPWSRIEQLVASAPPARVPWYGVLLGPARPARFALGAAATLLLGSGLLAVVPAQADRVGTIVSTKLPAAWQADSVEMQQLEQAAHRRFAALSAPQSELYVLNVTHANQWPELALVLQNVDSAAAERFYADLAADYPALAAFAPTVEPVEGDSPGSLLAVMFTRLNGPEQLRGLDENAARGKVLEALGELGLRPTEVRAERRADGTLVIDVSAMQIEVQGHTQEDLRSVGLSRETLGDAAFEQLLQTAAQ